jgi:hypothetical protein
MGETKILYLLHLVLRRIQQCNAGLLADLTAFIAVANSLRAPHPQRVRVGLAVKQYRMRGHRQVND